MNLSIFRAYDIRGKYPNEINEEIVSKITSSFISKLRIKNSKFRIIVGYDARLSSPKLYRAAIKTLQIANRKAQIVKAGMITTPMLSFLASNLKADAGIMITASHNPKEYNGLKIVGKNAVPISGKEIYKVMSKKI